MLRLTAKAASSVSLFGALPTPVRMFFELLLPRRVLYCEAYPRAGMLTPNSTTVRRGDCVQVEAGRYPFPTVVGEGGTSGEWFESVRRALRWNNRGAVQKGFGETAARSRNGDSLPGDYGTKGADEVEETDDEEDSDVEGEVWDIDADPVDVGAMDKDSGIGVSEVGSSVCTSPE